MTHTPRYVIRVTSPWLTAHPNITRLYHDNTNHPWSTTDRAEADTFCAYLNAEAFEGVSYEVVTRERNA